MKFSCVFYLFWVGFFFQGNFCSKKNCHLFIAGMQHHSKCLQIPLTAAFDCLYIFALKTIAASEPLYIDNNIE